MQGIDLSSPILTEDMEHIFASRRHWDEFRGCGIYISGAGGMIGSYLSTFLCYLNETRRFCIEIYAGIRSAPKAHARFGALLEKPYFHVVSGDVTEPFDKALTGGARLDYVIHAASPASPQFYGSNPVETLLPNVTGTHQLLDIARKEGVKALLFISSGSVYGDVSGKEAVDEGSVGQLDFLYGGNVYAEAKRCGEALCKAYSTEYGVPAKMARVCHCYGPTMDFEGDKRVFSEFVKNIVRGEDIEMKSSGEAKRPFCYMSDMISGLLYILLDGESGEPYNVANCREFVSIRKLANTLAALYSREGIKVVLCTRESSPGYLPQKDAISTCPSTAKLERLGWKPAVSLEEGFSRTVEYIRHTRNIR